MNPLDNLTIVRFAHAFESGGGVEQYLEDIDSALLVRNKLKIVRMYLSENTSRKSVEEKIGMGVLVKIPLEVNNFDRHNSANKQMAEDKWRSIFKYSFRDVVVYNKFLYKAIFKNILKNKYPRMRTLEAINVRQEAEKVFGKCKIDLIIMHYVGGLDSAAIIDEANKKGIPYIIINHFSNSYLKGVDFREQSAGSVGIAGVSSREVPSHLRKTFFNIGDGIDTEYFKKEHAQKIHIDMKEQVLFYPARIVRNKGQIDLIKAYAELREIGLKAKVVIAGHVDSLKYYGELKEFIAQKGLKDDVLFVGQLSRHELRDWYGVSSVLVFPTYQEGFGRILLEAQAMQVTPVAYGVGGVPEGIQHERTGFLVPKGDIAKLADHLEYLLKNEKQRRKMGDEGRRFIESRFSIEALAERHENYYLSVLK
jgi:glycosyltransferase involved in cell wall biosynthesis